MVEFFLVFFFIIRSICFFFTLSFCLPLYLLAFIQYYSNTHFRVFEPSQVKFSWFMSFVLYMLRINNNNRENKFQVKYIKIKRRRMEKRVFGLWNSYARLCDCTLKIHKTEPRSSRKKSKYTQIILRTISGKKI